MNEIRKACKTAGVSPKVVASAITGLIVYLLTKLTISIDPVIEQAINVLAMVIAGFLAPSGNVVVQGPPDPALVDPAAGDVKAPTKKRA